MLSAKLRSFAETGKETKGKRNAKAMCLHIFIIRRHRMQFAVPPVCYHLFIIPLAFQPKLEQGIVDGYFLSVDVDEVFLQ